MHTRVYRATNFALMRLLVNTNVPSFSMLHMYSKVRWPLEHHQLTLMMLHSNYSPNTNQQLLSLIHI